MTLVETAYFEEIIGGLQQRSHHVRHFCLLANRHTVLGRIRGRSLGLVPDRFATSRVGSYLARLSRPIDVRYPAPGREDRPSETTRGPTCCDTQPSSPSDSSPSCQHRCNSVSAAGRRWTSRKHPEWWVPNADAFSLTPYRRLSARSGCEAHVMVDDFDQLLYEASAAPADTWDFSWLEGRATEARPSWRYFDRVCERVTNARRLLDIDAGTANMLGDLPRLPPLAVATDSYRPSIQTAGPRLRARGAHVVQTQHDFEALPFVDASFDLVISRHPVETWWSEIARVLQPGGHYFSQQVGPHSLRDLSEFLMGPLPASSRREPGLAREAAESAGLVVDDLRGERTKVVFYDIGAVVYLLRVVVWTVPGFSVSRYRPQLRRLHEHIKATGAFETSSSRFLIDAHRPV